jgi:hypothetical protein
LLHGKRLKERAKRQCRQTGGQLFVRALDDRKLVTLCVDCESDALTGRFPRHLDVVPPFNVRWEVTVLHVPNGEPRALKLGVAGPAFAQKVEELMRDSPGVRQRGKRGKGGKGERKLGEVVCVGDSAVAECASTAHTPWDPTPTPHGTPPLGGGAAPLPTHCPHTHGLQCPVPTDRVALCALQLLVGA